MTRQTIRFEKACGFEDELTHDVVVERGGDCTYLWIPDADLSECTYADSVARIVFTRSEWQKLVSVPDAPITEAALQAAGWMRPIHHWLPPNANDEPWEPTVGVEFNARGRAKVRIVMPRAGLVDIPNCKTMAQLAALVEMLGGAE